MESPSLGIEFTKGVHGICSSLTTHRGIAITKQP